MACYKFVRKGGGLEEKDIESDAQARRDFLWRVIARFDLYIGSTNTKAAFILAFCTVSFGVVATNPEKLLHPFLHMDFLFWVVGCLIFTVIGSLLGALWFTLQVVNPFLKSPREPGGYHSRMFFVDVAMFSSSEKYRDSVRKMTSEDIEEDLAKQAYALAEGTCGKFKNLKRAIGCLLFGSVPMMIIYVVLRAVIAVFCGG